MRDLREDEVFKDGRIYCRSCGTPRQTEVHLFGKTELVGCLCACQLDARDEADRAARKRALLAEVRKLKTEGLWDASLRDCTFENDLGCQPESAKVRAYAEHFLDMRKRGAGLLLWGDVGTGKTFLAACVANYLTDRAIPVLMTGTGKILNALAGVWPSERNAYLESLNSYSLLILDDLGMERSTEFTAEQMFQIVDGWYRTGKPLIVTTNLTLKELKNPPDLARRRIYDRLLEMCTPIKINGQNIRELRAKEKMREMRESLIESEKAVKQATSVGATDHDSRAFPAPETPGGENR